MVWLALESIYSERFYAVGLWLFIFSEVIAFGASVCFSVMMVEDEIDSISRPLEHRSLVCLF